MLFMSVPTVDFLLRLYFAVINIAAFAMFAYDKYLAHLNEKASAEAKAKAAKTGKKPRTKYRRVPEAYLLAAAFFGGSFGAITGMRFFNHKTRKKKFKYLVFLFLVLQTVALLILTMGL